MNQTYCISSSQPPYESSLTIRALTAGLQVERAGRAENFLMKMILKILVIGKKNGSDEAHNLPSAFPLLAPDPLSRRTQAQIRAGKQRSQRGLWTAMWKSWGIARRYCAQIVHTVVDIQIYCFGSSQISSQIWVICLKFGVDEKKFTEFLT